MAMVSSGGVRLMRRARNACRSEWSLAFFDIITVVTEGFAVAGLACGMTAEGGYAITRLRPVRQV